MARIRSIKPAFWSDEKLAQLEPLARFTFLGLISAMADDYGRCKGDIRLVKASIWPLDDAITRDIVASHLRALVELKRIVVYQHEGSDYIQIVNWKRHQKIDRVRRSELPPPPKEPRNGFVEDSSRDRRGFVEDSSIERSGADRDMEGIRSGADDSGGLDEFPASEDLDPIIRDEDRAAPPAPLVELPIDAERFVEQLYSLSTEKRRLDVRRQLYDALDPRGRGARLRRGVFVKARDVTHLRAVCRAVMDDPPRSIDAAIVIVLEKLQDPPPGPTPSEVHKAESDQQVRREEAYHRAMRSAGVHWARDHPQEFEPIRAAVEAEFRGGADSAFTTMARESQLAQRCARTAGFPDFETWQREHSDAEAVHA